jgi:hypothetical protein
VGDREVRLQPGEYVIARKDALTLAERDALLDALARLDGIDFDGPDCE